MLTQGREQRLNIRAPRAQLSGPKQEGPKRETQGPARTPTPGRPRPAARHTQGHPSRGPDQVTPGTQPGGPDQQGPQGPSQREPGTQLPGADQKDPWRTRRARGRPRGTTGRNQERPKEKETKTNDSSAVLTRGTRGRDDSSANPKK